MITKVFGCPDCNVVVFIRQIVKNNDGIFLVGVCNVCKESIAVDIKDAITSVLGGVEKGGSHEKGN